MNSNLILFLYIMSFTTGLLSIISSIIWYIKKKKKFFIFYSIFFLSLVLINISNIVSVYLDNPLIYGNVPNQKILDWIFVALFKLLGHVLIIMILPHFIYSIINITLDRFYKNFYRIINIIVFSFTVLFFIFKLPTIYNIIQIILIAVIIHLSFIVFKHLKTIMNRKAKSIIYLLLILNILLVPMIFIESFLYLPRYGLSIYIILVHCFCIFDIDIYNENKKYLIEKELSSNFITEYNLTNKEVEVINLVLKGATNKKISGKLFASIKTIENHISNIYRKLAINSRYQLMSLILMNKE